MTLTECSIAEIKPSALSCLKKLRILDLACNQLVKCPSIQDLLNLEELNLENNSIESLDGVFSHSFLNTKTKLLKLNVAGNSMKMLQPKCLSGLCALRSLNLSYNNKLRELPNNTFSGLINLRVLDLTMCNFELRANLFAGLIFLEELSLDYADLDRIEPFAFTHFRNKLQVITSIIYQEDLLKLLEPFEKSGLIEIIHNWD
jgi:hypothetical protein